MSRRLTRAVRQGDLSVHYQPQVDVHTGACVGAEALVRWEEPGEALVPPSEFIPVAEAEGLIDDLFDHVLDTALRDRGLWRDAGFDVPVSVNVSAPNLFAKDFARRVVGRLEDSDTPPRLLTLELTESMLLRDPTRAAVVLGELRGAGVGVSLDDFGTGYSSLSRLRSLPIDELKIDRSFVTVLDLPIVRLVAELGHLLGHRIVAEGVERREDVAALAHLACHAAQGFALARPMPIDRIVKWMRAPQVPDTVIPPPEDVDEAMTALHELGGLARDLAAGERDPRDALCQRLRAMTGAVTVGLWEPTADAGSLVVTGADGLTPREPAPAVRMQEQSGVTAAYRSARSTFAPDVASHPLANAALTTRFGARSALWQPVTLEGDCCGVLAVAWSAPRRHLSPALRLAVSAAADHAALLVSARSAAGARA